MVPEESGSSTPPPLSTLSSTTPPRSVSDAKTTEEQPAETQKPVAEPIPQSSTGDSLVAQEPVYTCMSPEQIPVAVPELELPSQVQHHLE